MACTRAIVADALCEDPYLERLLFAYFPPALGQRFAEAIRLHRLRREIIATTLTNVVVDLTGTTFLGRTARETGASPADVVRATIVVEALTDARSLTLRAGEAGAAAELALFDSLLPALERAIRWVIESGPGGMIADVVERFRAPVAGVLQSLPAGIAARRREPTSGLVTAGIPRELADACADAACLREALDVVHLAAGCRTSPEAAAAAYWKVDELVDVAWLRTALDAAGGEDRWERRAVEGLRAELDRVQRGLACRLVGDGSDPEALARRFTLRHGQRLASIRTLLGDLRSAQSVGIAGLMVAVRELARLEEAS
jgi:glutamate dehydrogenase